MNFSMRQGNDQCQDRYTKRERKDKQEDIEFLRKAKEMEMVIERCNFSLLGKTKREKEKRKVVVKDTHKNEKVRNKDMLFCE